MLMTLFGVRLGSFSWVWWDLCNKWNFGKCGQNILSVVCLVLGVRNCMSGERAPECVLHFLLHVVNLALVC